jgi:hypothetical protein
MTHTPTPWFGEMPVVRDGTGRMIADCRSSLMGDNEGGCGGRTDRANAAFIARAVNARAVNAHYAMLAVLKRAVECNMIVEGSDWWVDVFAAIALAEGKP